jgi:hypothetical protein
LKTHIIEKEATPVMFFRLSSVGLSGSDCTASYQVVFDNTAGRTVSNFIDEVLTKRNNEWGRITVISVEPVIDTSSNKEFMARSFEEHNTQPTETHNVLSCVEYRYGAFVGSGTEFINLHGSRPITRASARGGWTSMDYFLYV